MLHLKVVFAGRPHARILAIDTEAALAIAGVVAVLTAADVPYNAFGLIDADQPVLCDDEVRFGRQGRAGRGASARAPPTPERTLLRVEYEDLPAVTDPGAALAPDAPLVHDDARHQRALPRPDPQGRRRRRLRRGRRRARRRVLDHLAGARLPPARSRHRLRRRARPGGDRDRRPVAARGPASRSPRCCSCRRSRLSSATPRSAAPSAGAKISRSSTCWRWPPGSCGDPVAMVWSREESMVGHHKRHPMTIRCRWGATQRTAEITAVEAEIVADGGAYASTSAEVTQGRRRSSPAAATRCRTSRSMATPSTPTTSPAARSAVSARPRPSSPPRSWSRAWRTRSGMDPVEMRRRNLYREGSLEPTQAAAAARRQRPAGVGAVRRGGHRPIRRDDCSERSRRAR